MIAFCFGKITESYTEFLPCIYFMFYFYSPPRRATQHVQLQLLPQAVQLDVCKEM